MVHPLMRGALALALALCLSQAASATSLSNASIGTNGESAPTASSQVGCQDTLGNFQPPSPTNPCPFTLYDINGIQYNSATPAILGAGSAQIGIVSGSNVGGYEFLTSTTPTIQNAAYVSGNCMGGFQTVSVARTSGGSGLINKFILVSQGGLATTKQIYIFSTNPSGSTCTDKSTFTLAAADMGKLIGTFALTPSAPTGTTRSEAENANMATDFVTSGNTNIYVAIVETASETPATTSDLVFTILGVKN